MKRSMGPLLTRLKADGYDVLVPDGGHHMSEEDMQAFLTWMKPVYQRSGADMDREFRRGAFWEGHENFDWLGSESLPEGAKKHYRSLNKSLAKLEAITQGKEVTGIIAFSQGAVLATLLAYLGAQGDPRFPLPRWGLLIAGFPPQVSAPVAVTYPIAASFPRLFVIGERDPVFPSGAAHLQEWAQCFSGGEDEFLVAPCGHDIPRDEASSEKMYAFIRAHSAD
jgi:predicted esterase